MFFSFDLDKLQGQVINEDIKLLSLLGKGGMGVAYKAHQKSLDRWLCIKFMQVNLIAEPKWFARFMREATVLCQLTDENVAKVYFVGLHEGAYPYLAMEYVQGSTLRELLPETAVDWNRTCQLFLQISDCMSRLHAKGLLHRDLKPDNIIVNRVNERDSPKILDFGLCALISGGETLTESSQLVGSAHYMAPEAFTSPQRSTAVDIYAFGCMFFECLTETPPFAGDSMFQIARMHAQRNPPTLPHVHCDGRIDSEALSLVIAKALAKEPNDRFSSFDEVSKVLNLVLSGYNKAQLKNSLNVTSVQQKRRWRKTLGTLVLTMITGALIASLMVSQRAKETLMQLTLQSCEPAELPARALELSSKKKYALAAMCWQLYLQKFKNADSITAFAHLAQCEFAASSGALNTLDSLWKSVILKADKNKTLSKSDIENVRIALGIMHTCFILPGSNRPISTLTSAMSVGQLERCRTALARIRGASTLDADSNEKLKATDAELAFYLHDYPGVLAALLPSALQSTAKWHDVAVLHPTDWRLTNLHGDNALSTVFTLGNVGGERDERLRIELLLDVLASLEVPDNPPSQVRSGIRFLKLVQDYRIKDEYKAKIYMRLLHDCLQRKIIISEPVSDWDLLAINRRILRTTVSRKDFQEICTSLAAIQMQLDPIGIDRAHRLVTDAAGFDNIEIKSDLLRSDAEQAYELLQLGQTKSAAQRINDLLSSRLTSLVGQDKEFSELLCRNGTMAAIECATSKTLSNPGELGVANYHTLLLKWYKIAGLLWQQRKDLREPLTNRFVELAAKDQFPETAFEEDSSLPATIPVRWKYHIFESTILKLGATGTPPALTLQRSLLKSMLKLEVTQWQEFIEIPSSILVNLIAHLLNAGMVNEAEEYTNSINPILDKSGDLDAITLRDLYAYRLSLVTGRHDQAQRWGQSACKHFAELIGHPARELHDSFDKAVELARHGNYFMSVPNLSSDSKSIATQDKDCLRKALLTCQVSLIVNRHRTGKPDLNLSFASWQAFETYRRLRSSKPKLK